MKKIVAAIGIVAFIGLFAGGVYYFPKISSALNQISIKIKGGHAPCLQYDEVAVFQYVGPRLTATSADVVIGSKITGGELFRFQLDGLVPNHYHT